MLGILRFSWKDLRVGSFGLNRVNIASSMNQQRSMSEHEVIARTHEPITGMTLVTHLAACGLREGQTVLVHTRLSALGWVVGGAQAVIQALLQVLGPTGTLMMPSQTWKNLDPSGGVHRHVPEAWWPTIRAHWPGYDPATTPSIGMGVVAELFRTWPGAQRSHHPVRSFVYNALTKNCLR